MTFTEFLATADADNAVALAAAKAYTETTGRMISPDMMLSLIASFGLVDALITTPTTNETKAVQAAFQFGSEFNLITGHPSSIEPILDIMIASGLISDTGVVTAVDTVDEFGVTTTENVTAPTLKQTLIAYANPVSYPFASKTLTDVIAIRSPGVLTACDHGGQDYVVSISAKDLFSFVTTTTAEMAPLAVTMYWREDNAAVWKQYQSPMTLASGNGVLSQVLRRPTGINAARHFKFEYTPRYAGLVTSVAVSVGS